MSSHLTIRVRRYRLLQLAFAIGGILGVGIYAIGGSVTVLYIAGGLLYVASFVLRRRV